ncbi:MAG: ferrous iron transport protein B [Planctomycetota bacterium]|jgi:ferrous iron transport protein B|nr:ferrous iron transport protein B [Planctomycetota bacterium]
MPTISGSYVVPTTDTSPAERSLADLAIGASATICEVDAGDRVKRRLLEMGLIPGETVRVSHIAPLGDPIVVEVQGYRLGLRRGQASAIHVTDHAATTAGGEAAAITSDQAATPLRRIGLIGNPNAGKTTVFNALTGLRQRVGNYPGVTVERRIGHCQIATETCDIIDLPGTYSLSPSSPDERIAADILRGHAAHEAPLDCAIVMLDASNLARNLLLFTQAADLRLPLVVGLTMTDLAHRRGEVIDTTALAALLGVPVVPMVAHKGHGIDALRDAIPHARIPVTRPWAPRGELATAIDTLAAKLNSAMPSQAHSKLDAERLLTGADSLIDHAKDGDERTVTLVEHARRELHPAIDPITDDVASRYRWIHSARRAATTITAPGHASLSDRIDRILVHRVLGLGFFAAIMYGIFFMVYYVAGPFMDLAESAITALGAALFGGMAEGALKSLLLDGVIGGVGGVLVFVPQIAMLFLLISLLEQSGYLARAAFLLDRSLAAVGLHGRSFIPMLSAHACAIPGIMAARGIGSRGDRLATMFVAPFMSCGARLPVYTLLIGVFLAPHGAGIEALALFGCYTLGIVMAVVTAIVLRKTALNEPPAAFLLELPAYRPPHLGQIARTVARNSWMFVRKAGTVILAFSIILWAALYYPRASEQQINAIITAEGMSTEQYAALTADDADPASITTANSERLATITSTISSTQVNGSVAGRAGKLIEPAIAPLGYDWQIGIGLIGAFAAREVFVSTMGVVYSVGEEADENDEQLHDRMRSDTRADGSPLWTIPTVLSVLVFFVIAMQCVSTLAVMRAETGWKWTIAQWAVMNSLAYLMALAVFQIGSALL